MLTCKWPSWRCHGSGQMHQQSQSSGKSGGCETEMMKQLTMQILSSELSYPDIHFSRKKPLWDSESVEQSSSDV